MTNLKQEMLQYVKVLREKAPMLYKNLEESGLKITDSWEGMAAEEMKGSISRIISACEQILRVEKPSAAEYRLTIDIPRLLKNLKKIEECKAGKENTVLINEIRDTINFIEKNNKKI